MKFCDIFKTIRISNGLTQLDIANKLNFAKNTVCAWEKGRAQPNFDTLIEIANIFNCSIDYLLGREDDFGNVTPREPTLSENEKRLLKAFNSLSNVAQRKLIDDAEFYASNTTIISNKKKERL